MAKIDLRTLQKGTGLWEVSATKNFRRIKTNMGFDKPTAQLVAKQLNEDYPGANARVVKGSKKK
ncbi:MAG: hypothetical protein M0R51_15025 [Clostridia bacterium]|jgi:hypothetical protein|nr:hypothetical protein [Clostridia bacterium]